MADYVYELLAKIGLDDKEFQDKLIGAGKSMHNTAAEIEAKAEQMRKSMLTITGAGAAALGAFAVDSVKTAAEFDASMSKVAAISGATGDDFTALEEKAKQMGATTKFSASESAEAMTYMAMAGWKTGDMLSGIEGIMNLAAASGENLATTSDIVTDALTAFGMKAEESGRFADILAAAATNSNTNVAMMGDTFKYVAPVAGALGYTAEDVAVAVGLMANSGIKASQSGTALRGILTRLAKPTKESSQAMNALGLSLDDGNGHMYSFMEIMEQMRDGFKNKLQIPSEVVRGTLANLGAELEAGTITQKQYDKEVETLMNRAYGAEGALMAEYAAMLAGQEGMSGLLAIVNASDEDFAQLTESIYNSNGAAEEMARIMEDNLMGDIHQMTSAWETFRLELGKKLMPYAREFIQWITDLIRRADEIIPKVTAVAAAFATFSVAINMTSIIKKVTLAFQAFMALIVANPVALVVAGIVAAITYLWQTNEEFRDSVITILNLIKETFQNFVAKIKERLDAMGFDFEAFKETVSTIWHTLWDGIALIIERVFEQIWNFIQTALDVIIGIVDVFSGIISGDWDQVWTGLKEIASAIWRGLQFEWELFLETLKDLADAVLTAFGTSWEAVWGAVKQFFVDIWNGIVEFFTGVIDRIKFDFELLKIALSLLHEWFAEIGSQIKETVNGVIDYFKSIPDKFKSWGGKIIEKAKEVAKNVGETFKKSWESAKTWGSNLISNIGNGISEKVSALGDAVKKIASSIGDALKRFAESAKTLGGNISLNIRNGFAEKIRDMYEIVRNMFSEIQNAFRQIIDAARSWGSGLMASFVNGIVERWNDLVSRLNQMAQAVRDRLHFTQPDKGPLSGPNGFESYAPDMMKTFAKGIKDNTDLVTEQVEKSFNFGDSMAGFDSGTVVSRGNAMAVGGATRNITTILQMDRYTLGRVVYELYNEESQRVGLKLAAGGKA